MDALNDRHDLEALWRAGYSIAELWGHSKAVERATSDVREPHPILWGILGIAEYQIDVGAGHRYLRERLCAGDWIAIGYAAPKTDASRLTIVPRIAAAKFGKKLSAIGKDGIEFVDLRVIHAHYLERC
jgi:hypothetical protein